MHTIETQSWLPEQAYLYFPTELERKGTDSQRMIFDGNTEFSSNETTSIEQFKTHSKKQNYSLGQVWTDNMILRFLYANNFKMDKTLSSIKEHTVWRETCLPVKLDNALFDFLSSGLLYIHGRDHKFRPIVVLNLYLLNPKTLDVDLLIRGMTFWFEYLIGQWMLPGQIENWVFIVNLKGMGLAALAVQSVRRLFSYLQENYKCRLYSLYVLNTPAAIYIPWQIVKKFLDEVTVKKIQFCKTDIPTALFTHTNKDQVEIQFGGTASNVTKYWPPIIPSNNYFVSKEDEQALVTKDQYRSLYNAGKLKNMHINEDLIAPPKPVYSYSPQRESKQDLNDDLMTNSKPVHSYSPPKGSKHDLNEVSVKKLAYTPSPQRDSKQDDSTEEVDYYMDYMNDMSECVSLRGGERIREFTASFLEMLNAS